MTLIANPNSIKALPRVTSVQDVVKTPNVIAMGNVNGNGYYVPNDCTLLMSIRSLLSTTVFVKIFYVNQKGEYNFSQQQYLVPSAQADGREIFIALGLMNCLITSVHIYPDRNVTTHRGWLYGQALIVPSSPAGYNTQTPILATLCSGYIENIKALSYPQSGNATSLQEQGGLSSVPQSLGILPAAAPAILQAVGILLIDSLFTVPSNIRIQPLNLICDITTSANPCNIFGFVLDVFGNLRSVWNIFGLTDVTKTYDLFCNIQSYITSTYQLTNVDGTHIAINTSLPVLYMHAGDIIGIGTDSLDLGDTPINLYGFNYEFWIDPQSATSPSNPNNAQPNPPNAPS